MGRCVGRLRIERAQRLPAPPLGCLPPSSTGLAAAGGGRWGWRTEHVERVLDQDRRLHLTAPPPLSSAPCATAPPLPGDASPASSQQPSSWTSGGRGASLPSCRCQCVSPTPADPHGRKCIPKVEGGLGWRVRGLDGSGTVWGMQGVAPGRRPDDDLPNRLAADSTDTHTHMRKDVKPGLRSCPIDQPGCASTLVWSSARSESRMPSRPGRPSRSSGVLAPSEPPVPWASSRRDCVVGVTGAL